MRYYYNLAGNSSFDNFDKITLILYIREVALLDVIGMHTLLIIFIRRLVIAIVPNDPHNNCPTLSFCLNYEVMRDNELSVAKPHRDLGVSLWGYIVIRVLGQYPPGQYPPGQYPPDNIPPDNIPPDNIPPDDISSKTCFSKKKKINSSVLNYPKTCVGKKIFFFLVIPVF